MGNLVSRETNKLNKIKFKEKSKLKITSKYYLSFGLSKSKGGKII
jgi:hypothetical protein